MCWVRKQWSDFSHARGSIDWDMSRLWNSDSMNQKRRSEGSKLQQQIQVGFWVPCLLQISLIFVPPQRKLTMSPKGPLHKDKSLPVPAFFELWVFWWGIKWSVISLPESRKNRREWFLITFWSQGTAVLGHEECVDSLGRYEGCSNGRP